MTKILIVEDDIKILRALAMRLRAGGYDTLTASDALSGVSMAVRNRPDLMILDINMPAGSGLDMLDKIRSHPDMPLIPTIFLTASKDPEYRRRANELGAHDFVEKPFTPIDLMDSVETALTGSY